jgi:glutaredoxin 3
MMMKLYIKGGCPWCVDAERWLQKNGYEYDVVDVNRDREEFAEMRRISGQTLAPVLELEDGRVLADFGAEDLPGFLGKK